MKDKAERHQWSVQQAGFDPTAPAQQTQQAASQSPPGSSGGGGTVGAAAGGAAGGAALGAVGGAIAGDTGSGPSRFSWDVTYQGPIAGLVFNW